MMTKDEAAAMILGTSSPGIAFDMAIEIIQQDAYRQGQQDCMKWVNVECKRQIERIAAIRNNLNSPLNEPS